MKPFVTIGLVVATVAMVLPSAVVTPVEAQDGPELPFSQELQDTLDTVLEEYGGMGVSASIIVPGYTQWNGVSGVSHGTTPITPDTVFHAGSTGKNFIAALVLQLVEEGTLSLDDPLSEWLPDYPHVDNTITIRQLLNHTSGIFQPNRHPDFYNTMFLNPTRLWTPDEILTTFLLEPYFPKGEGWAYSNANYMLLGFIIERATGSTVGTELRSRFFDPLGLSRTYMEAEEVVPEPIARGWLNIGDYAPAADADGEIEEFTFPPPKSWVSSMWTAAPIVSTAEDLATWAYALYHEKRVLSQESLDQMLTFVPTPPDEPILVGYGLGAYLLNPEFINGEVMYGHSGDAFPYAAVSMYLPEHRVALGLATNLDRYEIMGILVGGLVRVITSHLDRSDS